MTVSKHVDVLVVGAGISGIDIAFRLKERCPKKNWLILEGRQRTGGTWDLFTYPGVRSDSDMFTLGFPFNPWPSDQAIVGGDRIREYIEETARRFGILDKILFGHRVMRASWSSSEALWLVDTDRGRFTSNFLYLATGYYDYAEGYRPTWSGESDFKGEIVHPQSWPRDLDVTGKRMAVVGSGATAVTLVPALARRAEHVTMVQRTASYIAERPAQDQIAALLQRRLPVRLAGFAIRWKNILVSIFLYDRARRRPQRVSEWLREQVRSALPSGYPVERDFTPPYKPWDQRLCLVPDGDLFAAMRSGKVSIATGRIESFTANGLRLVTGEEIVADVVVTATGLNVRLFGRISLDLDGSPVDAAELLIWNGMMLSGVPNLAFSFGYINASWTLRSDLTARTFCRLLNFMTRKRFVTCWPAASPDVKPRPMIDFSSGYVQRALEVTPKQGDRAPWRVHQNYVKDLAALSFARIDKGLEFLRTSSGNRAR